MAIDAYATRTSYVIKDLLLLPVYANLMKYKHETLTCHIKNINLIKYEHEE